VSVQTRLKTSKLCLGGVKSVFFTSLRGGGLRSLNEYLAGSRKISDAGARERALGAQSNGPRRRAGAHLTGGGFPPKNSDKKKNQGGKKGKNRIGKEGEESSATGSQIGGGGHRHVKRTYGRLSATREW